MSTSKRTDGVNNRANDEIIAQSREGIPDDSSEPVDAHDDAVRFEQIVRGMGGAMPTGPEVPYDVDHATKAADEEKPNAHLFEEAALAKTATKSIEATEQVGRLHSKSAE